MTKKQSVFWILASTFTLISGCSEFLIKEKPEMFQVEDLDLPTRKLQPENYKKDVYLLLYALDNAYPPALSGDRVEYKKLRSHLEEMFKNKDVMMASQFCRELDDRLADFPDNHLTASIGAGMSCSLKRSKEPGHVGSNVTAETEVWSLKELPIGKHKVPVLSIRHFEFKESSAWKGFLDSVEEIKNTAPALIIDVRGNSGGDSYMAERLSEILYGAKPPQKRKSLEVQTPEAVQLERNFYQLKASQQFLTRGSIPAYLTHKLFELDTKLEQAKKNELAKFKLLVTFQETSAKENPSFSEETGFAKPIFILQDKICASSCEGLLEDLESHPYVTTVGENSKGSIHYGNVRSLTLPITGVMVQIPTKSFQYNDGRFLEKIGYKPKVQIPQDEDALEWAKKNIFSKAKTSTKNSEKKTK